VSVGCSLRYGQHYVRIAKETGLTRQTVYRIKDDADCDPGKTQPLLLKSNGGSTTHWPSSRSSTFT
jgi:hypothetical protein